MNPRFNSSNISEQGKIEFSYSPRSKSLRLEAVQFLPLLRDRLFEFYSDAFPLEAITPPWLKLSVLTPQPLRIMAGIHIDYQLHLHGIPVRWRSRITVCEPPLRFVHEQIRGPYRYRHHELIFEEIDGGTLCRDSVDYRVTGGRLVDVILVRPDLRKIFEFRQRKLAAHFASE